MGQPLLAFPSEYSVPLTVNDAVLAPCVRVTTALAAPGTAVHLRVIREFPGTVVSEGGGEPVVKVHESGACNGWLSESWSPVVSETR